MYIDLLLGQNIIMTSLAILSAKHRVYLSKAVPAQAVCFHRLNELHVT